MTANRWGVDAVWDIECAGWTTYVSGCLWTRTDGIEVYRDPEDLADALLALPAGTQTWAHAGGRYDVLWLADHLARRGTVPDAQVYMSGSSSTSVRFRGGPWLRDSARLLPMSLAQIAPIGGGEKGETSLPCVCGFDCGGYCAIDPGIRGAARARLESYLVQDVESLRDALLAVGDYAQEHDIHLRGTVGGTGWATAAAWCGLPRAEWPAAAYRAAREGYAGGRCEVARVEAPEIHRYDRRASYPAAICEPVPVGEMRMLDARRARLAWDRGAPGVYRAELDVPESLAPPLLVRAKGRLTFPWGRIRGAWVGLEIRHALEHGARLLAFEGGIAWERDEPILRPYAERIFALREATPIPAMQKWLKFLANSFTGKCGQSPDWGVVALGDRADDESYEPVGVSPHVWRRSVWRIPDCGHVHWSATLTARARVELHEQILSAGPSWCYSDTDSVFATKRLTRRIGSKLGEWAYEGRGREWRALAPKVYSYDAADGPVRHAKGVPGSDDAGVWDGYAGGHTLEIARGVEGLLTAARGERLFAPRVVTRRLHTDPRWCGARLRDGERTRAPHVADLASLPG